MYTIEVLGNEPQTDHICIAGWESGVGTVVKIKVDDEGYLYNLAHAWDGANNIAILADSDGTIQVNLTKQDLGPIQVSADTNPNAENNPIYVAVVDSVSGVEVHDYDIEVDLAKDATDTHEYTVSLGKTLILRRIKASASGAMKIEVKVGPATTAETKEVQYTNSADLNADFEFTPPIEITNTGGSDPEVVQVIRTNRDRQQMDVHSTIMGSEV
jgi:hypothetical protein